MKRKVEEGSSLQNLTKSSVWDINEKDLFAIWHESENDADLEDNYQHYFDIMRCAFEIEQVKLDKPEIIAKYEARGFTVGQFKSNDKDEKKWAVKKRPVKRVTDLTYENITHISTAHLLEVIDSNFGGGWNSLSQAIQDIILSGFDISTTTLPSDRLHNKGGMYDTKVADGFEVLEIPKGTWTEAIFAKAKPKVEKVDPFADLEKKHPIFEDEGGDEDEEDYDLPEDNYGDEVDEDDDAFDDDKLTEESYRTTLEEDPDLTLDGLEAEEDGDDY